MRKKVCTTTIMAFLMISTLSLMVLLANAALGITLNPTSGAPDDTFEVTGTDFAASTPVGIGFGAEVAGSDSNMTYSGTGVGPYYGKVSNWPIKPGSFVLTADTSSGGGIVSYYNDNGNGTLSGSFEGAYGDINYTTGEWSRTSTVDLTDYIQVYGATYTHYEFNMTPAEGITTDSLGAFTVNVTVPMQYNGTSPVTAIDEQGNIATSDFTVYGSPVIPEALTFGVIVLLSSVAVAVAKLGFRKRANNAKTI
ncbi:MAG: hypothetical protein NWE84_05730 [Candidatus Bathyarchaeota archaeon]|nr:hypothetical protein [Candidatus Bathyarchaeota archaeon]